MGNFGTGSMKYKPGFRTKLKSLHHTTELLSTPYATSFRRRIFGYHNAIRQPHTNIFLLLFSIH